MNHVPGNAAHLSSQFEQLAEQARHPGLDRAGAFVGALLRGIQPSPPSAGEVLAPLWAEESLHRARSMLRLIAQLKQAPARGEPVDTEAAHELSALYRALALQPERELAPCSTILRQVVRTILALFGPAAGGVELHTDITRLALPGFQRRALVLATAELVSNALLHAYRSSNGGTLWVTLELVGAEAGLIVTDDGIGCALDPLAAQRGIAGAMADLLEGTLQYRTRAPTGTTAVVRFPGR